MATQDTLLSIGSRFSVSAPTVMSIVNKVLYFLMRLKKIYIKFPKTEAQLEEVSRGFRHYPGN